MLAAFFPAWPGFNSALLGATTVSAQNDSAFLRMFIMILGALVVFTVIIFIAANRITGSVEEARGPDPRLRAAVVERIKPVGSVNVASSAPAAPAAAQSGADVAAAACNACHVAGVLGAPKIGDKAAWEARLGAAGGVDGLTATVISGKGGMPPRGGSTASDDEIRAAVVHLLGESGVDVAAAPAAAAPAEESAAAPAGPVEAVQQMAENAVEAAEAVVAAVVPAPAPAAATAPQTAAPAPQAAAPAAAAAEPDLAKGKAVYGTACFACHMTGAAGAPKLGDKAAWAPRIAQGMETLYASSINGKGAMPPKGGRVDIPDADIKAAVAYMVSESD